MIKMILAIGRNGELGDSNRPNGLPWDTNKEDMVQFQSKTQGAVVVMGGNTFRQLQSIGFKSGLPKRKNYVITKQGKGLQDGGYVKLPLETFKNCVESEASIFNYEPTWIIGGKLIYDQCMPYVEEVHITMIDKDFPEADTYMDLNFLREFELQSLTELNDYSIVYVYKRKK